MSEAPYLREPLHAFVRRYLAATGRPVGEELQTHFTAVALDGTETRYTYPQVTADARSEEGLAVLAPGSRTLDRMFRNAAARGTALRGRASDHRPMITAGPGCAAFGACPPQSTGERCAGCPTGSSVRLRVPTDATMGVGAAHGRTLVLRFVFVLDVRGPETIKELVAIDVCDDGTVSVLEAATCDDLTSWEPKPSLPVDPETYDRLAALARTAANGLLRPMVAPATDGAGTIIGAALRNLRARAEAEARSAPAEATTIDAHLRREELALLERQAVYATTRLVNVLALETPLTAVVVARDGVERAVDLDVVCDECGARAGDLVLDAGLHIACLACAGRCASCGEASCRRCAAALEPCAVCHARPCDACAATCHECGRRVCTADAETCARCGVVSCERCRETCKRDGSVLCRSDVAICVGGEPMCRAHPVATEDRE